LQSWGTEEIKHLNALPNPKALIHINQSKANSPELTPWPTPRFCSLEVDMVIGMRSILAEFYHHEKKCLPNDQILTCDRIFYHLRRVAACEADSLQGKPLPIWLRSDTKSSPQSLQERPRSTPIVPYPVSTPFCWLLETCTVVLPPYYCIASARIAKMHVYRISCSVQHTSCFEHMKFQDNVVVNRAAILLPVHANPSSLFPRLVGARVLGAWNVQDRELCLLFNNGLLFGTHTGVRVASVPSTITKYPLSTLKSITSITLRTCFCLHCPKTDC
jgi:hypothetical protein